MITQSLMVEFTYGSPVFNEFHVGVSIVCSWEVTHIHCELSVDREMVCAGQVHTISHMTQLTICSGILEHVMMMARLLGNRLKSFEHKYWKLNLVYLYASYY